MTDHLLAGQGPIVPSLFIGMGGIGSRIVDRIASHVHRLTNWKSQSGAADRLRFGRHQRRGSAQTALHTSRQPHQHRHFRQGADLEVGGLGYGCNSTPTTQLPNKVNYYA